jgi:hypothetical protein
MSRRCAMGAHGFTPEIGIAVPSSQHDVDPTMGRRMTKDDAGYMVAGA